MNNKIDQPVRNSSLITTLSPCVNQPNTDGEQTETHRDHREPRQPTIDDNDLLWETYVKEARKYDDELLDSWNESLSSLLLFAALFSAINTAFIIEIQKKLQPDEAKKTNDLLQSIMDQLKNAETKPIADWKADASALWLNSIFFTSLSFSLIASFGAILGKEMLSEYKTSGALNSIAEQGQIRQEKFDGLRKFRFRVLIHLLPVILQLSLALFLIGVVVFLWEMHTGVAMVVFLPVVAGFVAYITSLIIALQHNHSPFQTSVSRAIRLLYYHALELRSSARPMTNELTSSVQHAQLGWHAITRRISRFMQGMELWNHLVMSPHLFTTSFRGLIGQREDAESDVRSEKRGKSVREKKDITKASCVTWLLERAGSSQVQMLALNAIPLLPPHAVRPFLDQPNILRRCLYLYNSNLHRRPGQVKYLPDESQTATAIVAGTAIYHVMKSREENDSTHSSLFELAGDPDLFDIVESPDLTDEIDFQLITVIHCVQSQVGVDVWDINLLLRLLKKCSHKITSGGVRDAGDELEIVSQKPSSTNTPTQDSHILPSSQDLGSVGLLLDSIIWCSSQLDMGHPGQPILQTCSHQFEDILETLPNVLEKRKSVMLSSHAAIAISAVQWYKAAYVLRRTDPQTLGLEFGGVRRGQIRSAWFEVDKAAQFNDNIVMAFKLVDDQLSPATMNVYMSLMRLYEIFHIQSMSVSWKNGDDWDAWWIKTVQIMPGVLRIFQHVDPQNRLEATGTALRIIAQILPNDWMTADALRHLGPVPHLRYITPQDTEYGPMAISLMSSFLDNPTLQRSRATRDAAAEVLGWMMALHQPRVHTSLPSIITNSAGMFQQSTSIPSFLLSVLKDREADDTLRQFLQPQFDFLINLPLTHNGLISNVQLEASTLALTHLPAFPEPIKLVKQLRNFLDLVGERCEEEIWPESFVDAGVVTPHAQAASISGQPRPVRKLTRDDQVLVESEATCRLWTGTAIALVWKLFIQNAQSPSQYEGIIFSNDALLAVINCYYSALRTNTLISFSLFYDYLSTAQTAGKIPDPLKSQVEDTRISLSAALNGDWDALMIQSLTYVD